MQELVATREGDWTTLGLFNHSLQLPSGCYLSTFVLQNKVLKVVLLKFTGCLRANRTLCCQHTRSGGSSETSYQCKTATWCNKWDIVAGDHPAGCHPNHVDCSQLLCCHLLGEPLFTQQVDFACNQHLISSKQGVRDQEGIGTIKVVQSITEWVRSHVVLYSLKSYWNGGIVEDVGALRD